MTEIGSVSAGFATIEGALSQHQAATREWAEGQAAATGSSKDSWEDFYDGFSVNLEEYLEELASMVEAQANWQSNIESLVGRVSDETLEHLMRLGPEGAPLVAALVDGSAEELARFDELFHEAGVGAGMGWAAGIRESQALYTAAARQLGEDVAAEILDAVQSGEMSVAQAVSEYNLRAELEVAAKTDQAAADLLQYVMEVERTTAVAKVDADLGLAIGGANMWYYDTNLMRPMPVIDPNIDKATAKTDEWEKDASGRRPTPEVDADDGPARQVVEGWYYDTNLMRPMPIMSTDASPAYDETNSWQAFANRAWATANLALNAASAFSTLTGFLNSIPRSISIGLAASPLPGAGLWGAVLGRATGGPINRATGGPVHGPGGPREDRVPAYNWQTGQPYRLSSGEHVWTTAEVNALGGHDEVYRLRKAALARTVRFDIGGAVGAAYASRQQQWAAPHVSAPVMQPAAAPAVHVQPIDYAQLAAAVSQIQVRPQIGDDEVHRGARRGAALYGDRATWGTGPQPGRRS